MNTFVVILFIVASFVGGVLLHGAVIAEIKKVKANHTTDMTAIHAKLSSIENKIKGKFN